MFFTRTSAESKISRSTHQSMSRRCSHPYIVWLPTLHPRTFQENRSSRTFKRDEPYVRGENPVFAAERKRPYPAEDTSHEFRNNSRSSAGSAHSTGDTLRQRTNYRRGIGSQPLRLLVAYRGGRRLIFRSSRVDDDVCRRATVGRRCRRATCRRSAYAKKGWKNVHLDVKRLPESKDDRKGMWKNGGTIARRRVPARTNRMPPGNRVLREERRRVRGRGEQMEVGTRRDGRQQCAGVGSSKQRNSSSSNALPTRKLALETCKGRRLAFLHTLGTNAIDASHMIPHVQFPKTSLISTRPGAHPFQTAGRDNTLLARGMVLQYLGDEELGLEPKPPSCSSIGCIKTTRTPTHPRKRRRC